MTMYLVTAKHWDEGWELHIPNEGVTQVKTLDKADTQVRRYLETLHDEAIADAADIEIKVDLGGLEEEARKSREFTADAARQQLSAAARAREVAAKLRTIGLSVTDTATVLGLSRGRVSQLTKQ